jgi:hypothetical protein
MQFLVAVPQPAATEMQRDETADRRPAYGGTGVVVGAFDVRAAARAGESGDRVGPDDDRPRRDHPFG